MLLDRKQRARATRRTRVNTNETRSAGAGASAAVDVTRTPLHGARRGRVVAAEAGRAWVAFDGAPEPRVVAALAAPLPGGTPELAVGHEVVLVFEDGDPTRPIVVGWLEPAAAADAAALRVVEVAGRRIVLEATAELVLRCGEASLRLLADGRVFIEGRGVSSHARELNRIRGAAVKIN